MSIFITISYILKKPKNFNGAILIIRTLRYNKSLYIFNELLARVSLSIDFHAFITIISLKNHRVKDSNTRRRSSFVPDFLAAATTRRDFRVKLKTTYVPPEFIYICMINTIWGNHKSNACCGPAVECTNTNIYIHILVYVDFRTSKNVCWNRTAPFGAKL